MHRAVTVGCLSQLLLLLVGCGPSADEPMGSPDSYLLFWTDGTKSAPNALPVLKPLGLSDERGTPASKLFESGFGSEMVRTLYLAKQLVREMDVGAKRFSAAARRLATEPLCVVIGVPTPGFSRGLAVHRWLGAPVEHPDLPWLGLPAGYADDQALAQTVSALLAPHAVSMVTAGATADRDLLVTAFRMAIEVIAREWRTERGPMSGVPSTAGTAEQRATFADIRENRFVLDSVGSDLRDAESLLNHPGVAATVIYRMAQSRGVAQRVAPKDFYVPLAPGRLPEGVSPAAVLGPFRNFTAKLLGAWARAVLRGQVPHDLVDLIEIYGTEFPAEKPEVLRIFLVTTFGGTVNPGGVSRRPEDAKATIAELGALALEVVAGRKSLRDGVSLSKKPPR